MPAGQGDARRLDDAERAARSCASRACSRRRPARSTRSGSSAATGSSAVVAVHGRQRRQRRRRDPGRPRRAPTRCWSRASPRAGRRSRPRPPVMTRPAVARKDGISAARTRWISSTSVETCYRHPSRETGRLVLQLRAPDLPRLHDADVRSGCAARSARPGPSRVQRARSSAVSPDTPVADLHPDRALHDRLRSACMSGGCRSRGRRQPVREPARPATSRCPAPLVADGEVWRLVTERVPAQRAASTSASTC